MLAKINLGKQAADLCTSSLTQQLVSAYFAEGRWLAYVQDLCGIYRRRRDAMLDALAEFFPPEAEWTQPGGGLFIWATLPDFIDTEDLLAKAIQQESVAFVPGSAAYVDGRGGSSMRLNFSAVSEDDIVEGIRRIGKVIDEQISLYSTFTGEKGGRAASSSAGRGASMSARPLRPADKLTRCGGPEPRLADVVRLRRRPNDTKRGASGS